MLIASVVDLRPLVDLAFSFVDQVVLAVAVPAAAYFVLRKLHVDTTGAIAGRVIAAADNAAAVGLSRAQARTDQDASIDVKSAAIAHGVAYLETAFTPGNLAAAGATPARLAQLVEARVVQVAPSLAPPSADAVPGHPPIRPQ